MNAIAPSMSLIPSAAPMASASPPPSQGDDAQGDGFARCLERARDHDASGADEAPQRPGGKATTPAAKADRGTRDQAAARTAGSTEAPDTGKVDADAAAAAETSADDAVHDDTRAPDLAALLPGWTPPPPPGASAAAAPAAADDGGLPQGCAAVGGTKASSASPRDPLVLTTPPQAAVGLATTPANDSAAATALPSSAALQRADSEQRDAAPALPAAPLATSLAGAPIGASTTPASRASEAPATSAMLPAPIDSPQFAPSLATQVRWWASDGVQQAQLLLNPAEMGPVAVKIVLLDGREARIDFSADLAATRSAIEAALPVLAATLDDGGLKLTGGGVHDGSAQHQPAWHAHGVTHRTAARAAAPNDEQAPNAATKRNAAGRGMVDLVA
jgi:flagellar hook-length control protein FliK